MVAEDPNVDSPLKRLLEEAGTDLRGENRRTGEKGSHLRGGAVGERAGDRGDLDRARIGF